MTARNRAREWRRCKLDVFRENMFGTWEARYDSPKAGFFHLVVDKQESLSAAVAEMRRVHRLVLRRIIAAGGLYALLDCKQEPAVTPASPRNGWAHRRISIHFPEGGGAAGAWPERLVTVSVGRSAVWDGTDKGRAVAIKQLRANFHQYLRERRQKRLQAGAAAR